MIRKSTNRELVLYVFVCFTTACHFSECQTLGQNSQSLQSTESDGEKYLSLGIRAQKAGRPETSRVYLRKAIAAEQKKSSTALKASSFLRSNIPRYPVTDEAEAANLKGYKYMSNGKNEAAIRVFEFCISQYPKFEWPFYNLACIYLQKGNGSKAKKYAEQAVTINPNYANGWLALANSYLLEKNILEARKCATKALSLDPENSQIRRIAGYLQNIGH